MIVELRDAVYPAQRTFKTSHKEKIGWVIFDLLNGTTWARIAQEMVPAPPLGGARVVRHYRREGGALEIREVRCSKKVFKDVETWIEALRAAGWRSWPVAQGQQEEKEEEEINKWLELEYDQYRKKQQEEEEKFNKWLEEQTHN